MEPSAVIPHFDRAFPLDYREPRRPSNLTVSTISSKGQSADPSPTRSRFRESGDISGGGNGGSPAGIVKGPFVYVGPEKKRFHAQRIQAPYPLPCGLEELSR